MGIISQGIIATTIRSSDPPRPGYELFAICFRSHTHRQTHTHSSIIILSSPQNHTQSITLRRSIHSIHLSHHRPLFPRQTPHNRAIFTSHRYTPLSPIPIRILPRSHHSYSVDYYQANHAFLWQICAFYNVIATDTAIKPYNRQS